MPFITWSSLATIALFSLVLPAFAETSISSFDEAICASGTPSMTQIALDNGLLCQKLNDTNARAVLIDKLDTPCTLTIYSGTDCTSGATFVLVGVCTSLQDGAIIGSYSVDDCSSGPTQPIASSSALDTSGSSSPATSSSSSTSSVDDEASSSSLIPESATSTNLPLTSSISSITTTSPRFAPLAVSMPTSSSTFPDQSPATSTTGDGTSTVSSSTARPNTFTSTHFQNTMSTTGLNMGKTTKTAASASTASVTDGVTSHVRTPSSGIAAGIAVGLSILIVVPGIFYLRWRKRKARINGDSPPGRPSSTLLMSSPAGQSNNARHPDALNETGTNDVNGGWTSNTPSHPPLQGSPHQSIGRWSGSSDPPIIPEQGNQVPSSSSMHSTRPMSVGSEPNPIDGNLDSNIHRWNLQSI